MSANLVTGESSLPGVQKAIALSQCPHMVERERKRDGGEGGGGERGNGMGRE